MLVGNGVNLLRFDAHLPLVELARALHRDPLADRHGARACDQAGETGYEDGGAGELRTGDARDEREI